MRDNTVRQNNTRRHLRVEEPCLLPGRVLLLQPGVITSHNTKTNGQVSHLSWNVMFHSRPLLGGRALSQLYFSLHLSLPRPPSIPFPPPPSLPPRRRDPLGGVRTSRGAAGRDNLLVRALRHIRRSITPAAALAAINGLSGCLIPPVYRSMSCPHSITHRG